MHGSMSFSFRDVDGVGFSASRTFDHFWLYGHAFRSVGLPAWNFLLMFYKPSSKMYLFELGAWERRTDRQADSSFA